MKFEFIPHIVDTGLPEGLYAQTAAADLDGDGRPEFITGQQYGDIFWYKPETPDRWIRHLLGKDSPSDVGGCAFDVDGDGRIDFVTGGAWYRNLGDPDRPFERFEFDPDLGGVHDVVAADINGDGRLEVITMSDQNNLRWYRIPEDPTARWIRTDIGPAVHAGATVGDIDGDGDLDIVRTDLWYENVRGDGTEWVSHHIGFNSSPPKDFSPSFAYYATYSAVCDMNGSGSNDIVFADAEIPGGRIWWMENIDGRGQTWKRHEIAETTEPRRGAYHSLYVGDLDGDGDYDVFSCEMEGVPGEGPPRWYIWENVDGKGGEWREHVIYDQNLGGHDAVVADFTGNGKLDIVAKPWRPNPDNAVDGEIYVVFLENVSG